MHGIFIQQLFGTTETACNQVLCGWLRQVDVGRDRQQAKFAFSQRGDMSIFSLGCHSSQTAYKWRHRVKSSPMFLEERAVIYKFLHRCLQMSRDCGTCIGFGFIHFSKWQQCGCEHRRVSFKLCMSASMVPCTHKTYGEKRDQIINKLKIQTDIKHWQNWLSIEAPKCELQLIIRQHSQSFVMLVYADNSDAEMTKLVWIRCERNHHNLYPRSYITQGYSKV